MEKNSDASNSGTQDSDPLIPWMRLRHAMKIQAQIMKAKAICGLCDDTHEVEIEAWQLLDLYRLPGSVLPSGFLRVACDWCYNPDLSKSSVMYRKDEEVPF